MVFGEPIGVEAGMLGVVCVWWCSSMRGRVWVELAVHFCAAAPEPRGMGQMKGSERETCVVPTKARYLRPTKKNANYESFGQEARVN